MNFLTSPTMRFALHFFWWNCCWMNLIQSTGKVSKFPLDLKKLINLVSKSFSNSSKREEKNNSLLCVRTNTIFIATNYIQTNKKNKRDKQQRCVWRGQLCCLFVDFLNCFGDNGITEGFHFISLDLQLEGWRENVRERKLEKKKITITEKSLKTFLTSAMWTETFPFLMTETVFPLSYILKERKLETIICTEKNYLVDEENEFGCFSSLVDLVFVFEITIVDVIVC